MFAIRPDRTGGPDVLTLTEHPTPAPGPDEVLVHSEAIGVNFIDIYHRRGLYPLPFPLLLGQEGAGVIERVGGAVASLRIGDRVAWCGVPGSYATQVVVPTARAVPIPAGMTSATAAASLLQGLTAHYLAISTFALRPGHTAVVHAAAGGVGQLLVQFAKLAGARVLATSSSPQKHTRIRALGADVVATYDTFAAEAKRLTGGRGVDVVYDSVGATTFLASIDSLAPRGVLALYGQASGPVPPIDPQLLSAKGSLFLTRPTLRDYTLTRDELIGRAEALFARLKSGTLTLGIDRTLPLAQAAEAHRALESKATTGKVLLIP